MVKRRRIATTDTLQRLTAHLKHRPTYIEISEATGIHQQLVGYALREERTTQHVQEAVAKWAGLTVEQLFGPFAHTRLSGRKGGAAA